MKRNWICNSKKILSAVLAGTLMLSLAACGGKNDDTVDTDTDSKEYVYVPEYIEMNTGDGEPSFYNAQLLGNYMYYPVYSYNEEAGTSEMVICRSSVDGSNTYEETAIRIDDTNMSVNQFVMDDAGNAYLIGNIWSEDGNSQNFLMEYDAQGNLVYQQDLTSVMAGDEENSYIYNMAMDQDGNIYCGSSTKVFLFSKDGTPQGTASMNGDWINFLGQGKDGKVYACYYGANGMNLAEVDFQSKTMGTAYENFPGNGNNGLLPGIEKDFLVQDGTKVYEYDLAAQQSEEVLEWLDCDIDGNNVSKMALLEDGTLLAVIETYGNESMTTEIVKLVKTKASEVTQKTEIVVGSLYDDYSLKSAAVAFNKSNDTYHISLKAYIDYNNWTENTHSDAIAAMNNEITSGNGPDIISLEGISVASLISKGVFEDLNTYLESSSVISKEDLVESVLEGYTFGDTLIGIPRTFYLATLAGKTSEVGAEMGWTLEELMAYADEHPEQALLAYGTKVGMMQTLLNYSMGEYVDDEAGTCNFDTPEFVNLLEFVSRFPDEIDWENDDRSEPKKIQDGDVLLSSVTISDFSDIQLYPAMFNEEVTFIGYPNNKGTIGCMVSSSGAYGISSQSANKDGAWAFIESLLTSEENADYDYGFSANRNKLQKQIDAELNIEYMKDENGELMLDENGDPIPEGGNMGIGYGDWEYDYHQTTEEEVNMALELMDNAVAMTSGDEQILTFIAEETDAFFQGQKTAEQVAETLQNRVQLYINENR